MPTTRQEILSLLKQKPQSDSGQYELFKLCFEGDDIDPWVQGVVNSLHYRPNKYLLVTDWPIEDYVPWTFYSKSKLGIYESLVVELPEMSRRLFNLPTHEDFIIRDVRNTFNVETDKRLASYCCVSKDWKYPKRKNTIVCKLGEGMPLFDITSLWQEIYARFKPSPFNNPMQDAASKMTGI